MRTTSKPMYPYHCWVGSRNSRASSGYGKSSLRRQLSSPSPATSDHPASHWHGPPVHGSSAWNQAGLRGQGIKVGVIDLPFGFNGFSHLMGTELPSTVQARCYTSLGKFSRFLASCGNSILGSDHGTLVAEAVIDIAPEVSLYIATPQSPGRFAKCHRLDGLPGRVGYSPQRNPPV